MKDQEYKQIAEELNSIYDDFYNRMISLRSRAAEIMKEIDSKLKDEQVQAVLNKIKNID